jgi:hypothetical protein
MQTYSPPLEQVSASRVPMALLAAIGVVLWGAVGYLTYVSVPRGDRLFTEFHMAIPFATHLIIRFSFFAVPLLAIMTLMLCVFVRQRLAWLWLAVGLPILLGTSIFISLYLPITKLLQALFGTTAGWWEHF